MQDSCTQTSLNKAVSPFHPVGLFFFWMLLVRGATSPGSALGVEKEESLTTLFLKERAPLATRLLGKRPSTFTFVFSATLSTLSLIHGVSVAKCSIVMSKSQSILLSFRKVDYPHTATPGPMELLTPLPWQSFVQDGHGA